MGFWPTWNRYKRRYKEADFQHLPLLWTVFINIIHSPENEAIKESTTSVNANYKSSHVASNFMVIYIMLIRRVWNLRSFTVVITWISSLYFMRIITVQMSLKIHFRCENPPLCSGVIAVPSGPKSHTFTVILAVFAPQPRWRHKPWKGLLIAELSRA